MRSLWFAGMYFPLLVNSDASANDRVSASWYVQAVFYLSMENSSKQRRVYKRVESL